MAKNKKSLSLSDFLDQKIVSGPVPTPLTADSFGIGEDGATVPLGVKDTPYRRETLVRGNKAAISNVADRAILEALNVKPPVDPRPEESLFYKTLQALDYPASKVRQLITGVPSEQGNNFGKVLKKELDVPNEQTFSEPTANYYKPGVMNPMAIDPRVPKVIPGTNIRVEFADQMKRAKASLTDPTWWANRSADASGMALDILTDPLTFLGPGLFTQPEFGAARNVASIRTSAAFGLKSKYIPLTTPKMDTAVMEALKSTGEVVGDTKLGNILGKAFIPGFKLPEEYYNLSRDSVDKVNYEVSKLFEESKSAFNDLTPEERKLVSHYVEGTDDLSSISDPESVARIQKGADEYIRMRDAIVPRIQQAGMLHATPDPTYVPHVYPGSTQQQWIRSGPEGSIKEGSPFFTKGRTYDTLADAKAAGKEPTEDIGDILDFYGQSALTEVNKRDLIDQTTSMFGRKVKNIDEAKSLLDQLGDGYGIYAPRGTFSLHSESFVPKSILKGQGPMIQLSIDDLKQGPMFSKNVPVFIIDENIAKDLNRLEKVFGNDEATKGMLGLYDKALQYWKGRVTVTSPGFHLRNLYSNVSNAYLGGLEDIGLYKKATQVANGKPGTFAGRSHEDILEEAKRYGVYSPTAGHWMKEMFGPEVLKDATTSELLNPLSKRFAPVEAGREVGSAVENNARLALFLDRIAKGDDPMKASLHVKKYLFDYSELTPFERNVMKRAIPFYTWIRKNAPLQLEGLAQNPKVAAQVGKLTGNTYGGNDEKPEMLLTPRDFRTPLIIPLSGDPAAPTLAKLGLPLGDLDNDMSMGVSPIFSIAKNLYSLANDTKEQPDNQAPELLNTIYENLPKSIQDEITLKKIQHKYTKEEALAMDPRVKEIMNQLSPMLMKISRIIPTEGNKADPNYQQRLTSFFTGVPITTVDLRLQKSLNHIQERARINNAIRTAEREGTIQPYAVNILRSYLKLN